MNVPILCTENSARSILDEARLNARGAGRLTACLHGSARKAPPHLKTPETLRVHGHDMAIARSKSRSTYAGAATPVMDIIQSGAAL